MPDDLDVLEQRIFGSGGAPARAPASADQWRQTLKLEDLEQQYNLPSGLMTSVLRQESGGDPRVKSSAGAQGLFQFMPATARQYKIDPFDPQQAAPAAAKELSTLYKKYGGDVDRTLAAWNWGQGNVDRKGMANMPRETRGFLTNVKRFLSPASAEAATMPQQPQDLDALEQRIFGGMEQRVFGGQAVPQTPPAAPGATQPPPPVVSPTTTPTTQPGASQGPPTPRLSLGDPAEAATEPEARATIEAMRARQMAPLAVGGGTATTPQPVTDPAALLAIGGRAQTPPVPQAQAPVAAPAAPSAASSTQIEPIQRGASEVVQAELQRPHEAGTPLSAVPAIAVNTLGTVGGAALGAPFGPVGSAAGAALGGALATRANTAMGLSGQEKPLLETPWANVYPSDLLGAIPLGIAGTSAAIKGTVRNLPGANVAKHEIAAERLKALEQRTAPPVPSDVLWQKAGQSNTPIATADVWRTAGDVVRRKSRTPNLSADDPALKAAQDLLNLAKKHGGPVPIQELDDARRNLVPHLRDPDVKRLYGAVLGDMDNAVTRGVPGAADLRGAIAATRKEHSLAELTDLWSDGKGIQQVSGDITQVFGKRIRNQFENRLRDDKTFAGAFTPAELADIRGTLREVGKLTRITNPESQGAMGRGLQWLGRLGSVGYGAMTQDMWTGGMLFLASEGASAVLARAMQSPAGRWALREAIREGNGQLTHGSLSAIAALLAREAAPEAPAPAPAPTP